MKFSIFVGLILLTCLFYVRTDDYQDKLNYMKKLISIQDHLQSNILDLKNSNSRTTSNVENIGNSNDLSKVILQEGVQNQRSLIQNALKQSRLPLQQNHWTCKNLSTSEKNLVQQKIKTLQDKTNEIKNKIQNQGECQRTIQMKSLIQFLKLHIESLQDQLKNSCQPPRKDQQKINNLDSSQKWIYGSISAQDYAKNQKNEQLLYQLIKCPQNSPFLIKKECSSCPSEQIYSLSDKKCIECPNNTIFLLNNHECRDPSKKSKISDLNNNPQWIWGAISPNQYEKKVNQLRQNNLAQDCSKEKPFSVNNQCASCQDLYNVQLKKCVSCNNQQQYIKDSHQCKKMLKKANLDGNNWIYGTINENQYSKQIQELQKNNIVNSCPKQNPFPTKDRKNCQSCNNYFDLSKNQCVDCQKNFSYDKNIRNCIFVTGHCINSQYWNGNNCIKCNTPGQFDNNYKVCNCPENNKLDDETGNCLPIGDNIKNNNKNAGNFIGQLPIYNKFIGQCPQDYPFYDSNSKKCVSCQQPKNYFNFNNLKCQSCQNNKSFSINTKQCVFATPKMNTNLGDNKNYCCGIPAVDNNLKTCPTQTPYFDNLHCIACTSPKYFNFQTKKCSACQQGKLFSIQELKCLDEILVNGKYKSNKPQQRKNYYGNIPTVNPDTQSQKIIECPNQTPYYNKKQCVKCNLPNYFNFESNNCEICKEGQSFDTNTRRCIQNTALGQFKNSNMINADNFIGTVPQFKKNYPKCDEKTRYFDGKQCVSCILPNYFDFDKNSCSSCNTGYSFDTQSRLCLIIDAKYKTDMNAGNIYYNGNFQQLKNRVNSQNKDTCPKQKPYYDKSKGQCISCWGDNSLFNFKYNHCTQCPGDNHFNENNHICFQNGIAPTVERMVMNSFSWI